MVKMRGTLLAGAIGLAMLAALSTSAYGTGWYLPPEQGFPGWQTTPPQRDVRMDFAVNPVAPPGAGIPGAEHWGTDDDVLKVSDFIELTGDVQWYGEESWLGIDNRTEGGERCGNEGDKYGTIVLHLDNWDDPRLEKHVYLELVYGFAGCGGWVDGYEILPDYSYQAEWGDVSFGFLGNWDDVDWYLHQKWLTVRPNPPWEEIVASLTAPAGAVIVFDSIFVATECVPEPSALGLMAVGAIGLLWRRRRA